MSMAYLLLDAAICIVGLFFIGYPLTRLSHAIKGAERLAWALILGICAMIVFVRTINSLAAIDKAVPFIAVAIAGWLAYHWRKKTLRDLCIGDLRALNLIMSLCWFAALMLLVITLNYPVLKHHALVFEASPNHDAIYYITNARWMLGHSFDETVTYSANEPLFWISRLFFGEAPPLGRVGAEGLLAFVSALTGQDPLAHFQAMQAVAMIAGAAVSTLLLPRPITALIIRPTLSGLLIVMSVVFAPAFIQIAINSSFANAYGIVIMTAFALISLRSPTRGLDILQPLLFAGVLATYPELSPIGLVIIGGALLFELILRSQPFKEVFARGMRVLAAVVIAVIALPWISIIALMALKYVYFAASTQGNSWPDPYAGLNPLQLPLAVFTTSRSLASIVPGAFNILIAAILCLAFARSVRRSRDTALSLGVTLALIIFLGYIFYKDFNYGKLKILEYFSLFLAPSLIVACGFTVTDTSRSKLDKLVSYAALLGLVCVNVGASYLLLKQGMHTADKKYIAKDFVDAVKAADNLPGYHYLAARFTTEPFFYSMWVSYFSHEPVVFSKYFGTGGYMQPFTDEHPAAPYDTAPTAIVDERAFSSSVFGAKVLGRYGRFLLLDQRNSSQLSSTNLYANEGGWSWMGKQLVLDISGDNARFVDLALSNRFAPEGATEKISITIDSRHCEFLGSTTSNKLSLAIPEGPHHQVTIVPMGRAVSPSILGQSNDDRILTYQVSKLALSTDATFQPVTCGSAP
ncbi:hypothetical protein RHOFW510R12_05045 [Rhodanobacter sp. FW510-R12]|nr:hypothetical protein RHOFW104R8_10755 [Rhodanobacter sp. FW104-R8]KZC28724.1 hypothetical protein RhoFW510T8_09635 [Rhodanobacter sp. FW510-T8]KZC33152.1 hypothetical protein RhoFW510R10_09615 [Rhodanobacter sp. FW510-R10]